MAIADRQRGLISRDQLIACGICDSAIRRLRRLGLLRSKHRGVYLVGHGAVPPFAKETAAVLACGADTVVTARSSLGLWGIVRPIDQAPVDVATPGRKVASRPGIRVHRTDTLQPSDIVRRHGLRITSPARALLEFAATADPDELDKAVREAIALKLVDRPKLLAVIDRYPRHRGTARLRAVADPDEASQITKSEAEERLRKLLETSGAPPSRTQFKIGRYEADRCWVELMVIVEVDGVQFHSDGRRMEEDNVRTDFLRSLGYVVLRFTRRQIVHEPEYVLMTIGRALGAAEAARAQLRKSALWSA